jgi:hypothetical protein
MFRRVKKREEPSVAFQLGEAMGKYTDAVIEQIKAKDAEIERLRTALATAHVNLLRLAAHPDYVNQFNQLQKFLRHVCAGESVGRAAKISEHPLRESDAT